MNLNDSDDLARFNLFVHEIIYFKKTFKTYTNKRVINDQIHCLNIQKHRYLTKKTHNLKGTFSKISTLTH